MSAATELAAGIFHAAAKSARHDMVMAAVSIAELHPYAIDYIQQAPVLIVPSIQAGRPGKTNEYIIRTWRPLLEAQPKLRELMEHFKLAYQLRAVYGCVLQPWHKDLLLQMSQVNPSTLAQAIPDRIGMQKTWLTSLYRWVRQMRHQDQPENTHLEWAVRHFAYGGTLVHHFAYGGASIVADIADFAARGEFNPSWNLTQARAATERWHTELARTREFGQHQRQYGMDWDAPVDYGNLPLAARVNGYEFVALRSGEDLFKEGQAMHNCVSSYFGPVHGGRSRLYAVRQGDTPVATLELTLPLLGVRQLKGPCNAKVSEAVERAVNKFVKQARKGL